MKSLIPAATLALLLHAFFLVMPAEWTHVGPKPVLRPRPVAMTLSYRVPLKPVVSPPKIPPAPLKAIAPPPSAPLKTESKPSPPKPRPKIRKPEKTPARPLPTPKKRPPASPSPIPDAHAQKDVAEKTAPVIDKALSGRMRATIPEKTPPGPDLKGRHKEAPAPAPPPLVRARPRYRKNPSPRYPRTARRRGHEGTVLLEVLVNRKGNVKKLRIMRSSGHTALDKAALSAVQKWVFVPGKRGEEYIDMWVKIPVSFRLK